MTTFRTIAQFCAAALMFASLAGAARGADMVSPLPGCSGEPYPTESLKEEEEGVSIVGLFIRADGTVADSTILVSSGSARLDRASISALSRCGFKPVQKDNVPVDAWIQACYVWYFDDDEDKQKQLRRAASAAVEGDATGFFRVYFLLARAAKTDADRERALLMLLNAAERGHALAQFNMGSRYERGDGVEASLEKAQQWYAKAAAQGNVLARQRLERGILAR